MIYLDNSATSPIDEEVLEAMLPFLREEYGNPSSKYYCKAVNAKKAVEEAREKVAQLLGAKSEEIVFTSGATESTNFIIKGYLDYRKHYVDGKNHIVTSLVEHKATLNTCRFLNGDIYSNNDPTVSLLGATRHVDRGFEASFASASEGGEVTVNRVRECIKTSTAMVSVIHVNNEVGTINNLVELSSLCHDMGIVFHTDITQSLGKIPVNVKELGIDYASCSAHKIYGPKGVGAAYLLSDDYGISPITAFMHGGEQELGFRAGTLAVHNIVGFGKAAEIAKRDLEANERLIRELDAYALGALGSIKNVRLVVSPSKRIPGIISIIVDAQDFHNERFIKHISDSVAISTGSACSAGEPSHVIKAIGLEDKVSKVLRITINKYTTKKDIDSIVRLISDNIC